MSILHGKIFNHFKYIRTNGDNKSYEARVPVLMMLISASDKRLQVWHGLDSIMESTGYSRTPIIEALSWLQSHGAIYNVPKTKRLGHAAKCHANRKVWQLTGLMDIEGVMVQYLLLKADDIKGSLQEIQDHTTKISLQDEPEIGLQDRPKTPKNEEIGLQSDTNIGLQNDTTKELGKENLVKAAAAPISPIIKSQLSDNKYSQIFNLIKNTIESKGKLLLSQDLMKFKGDIDDYKLSEWQAAIETLSERMGEQDITRPYPYLWGIIKGQAQDKDNNRIQQDVSWFDAGAEQWGTA